MRSWIVLLALCGALAAGVSHASVNHGDFLGTGVDFLQVIETTQTTGDAEPLWNAPVLHAAGSGLQFFPPNFASSCAGMLGAASDTTSSNLDMTVMAQPGKVIEVVALTEFGDANLTSFPPFGTPATNASPSLSGFVTVLEDVGGPIAPVVIPFPATATPSASLALPTNFGMTQWQASVSVDVTAAVPNATKLLLSIDDTLASSCAAGNNSVTLQKQAFDGPMVTLGDAPVLPALTVTKTDALQDDVYGDGNVSPGDTVRYTVTLANADADATQVVFTDLLDPKTRLVAGSVTTSQGSVTLGNLAGDAAVEVAVGTLASGTPVVIGYDGVVEDHLDPSEISAGLANQGTLTGSNFESLLSDDPDTPAVGDPTATPLAALCDGVEASTGCRLDGSPPGPCLGTQGGDVILGTDGADIILGRGGDDNLIGRGGRDLICGGGGDDFVEGGDGRDRIDGGDGHDILEGAAGSDTISGGEGDDQINGRGGQDRLDGGPGLDDRIDGGGGSDRCSDPDGATFVSCGRSCGLGFELAFGLLPLLWARSRWRARAQPSR